MIRKIENIFAVALVVLLTVGTLAAKILQSFFHVQIPDANLVVVHLVFVFSCVAGIITWREDRHLSLASVADKFPQKVKIIVEFVKTVVMTAILVAMFINSLCQAANPMQFSASIFGLSTRVLFAFLPLCYIALVIMIAAKKNALVPALLGIVLGFFCSAGTISGVLYYVFMAGNLPALFSLNELWVATANKFSVLLIVFSVVLAFLGLPLFVVFSGISYILFSGAGGYVDVIPLETYRILSDRSIAAIPLFTIAGYILAQGSAGRRFVDLFKALFGWFRGGTVIAAVIVVTFFSTFTGVSGVTILALGPLLSVVLKGSGYSEETAESLVTSSGSIGLLFPPSAAIIMYGTVNYFSVDIIDLFKAAIIPGTIMALAMMAVGIVKDRQTSRPNFSLPEVARSFWRAIPEILMPVSICVCFFLGIFDLFEVAAFSVFYAFLLATVVRRDFSIFSCGCGKKNTQAEKQKRRNIFSIILESIPVSGGVLFILGAASGISYFMLDANVPMIFSDFATQFVHNQYVFLILMNILLLIAGCLMDMFSAILIVSPLILPLAEMFSIDAVRASVIFLMNLSIGFLTPPVGMDLFIASYTFNRSLPKVIRGIVPFLLVQLAVLLLITYFPWFTTALL